jgi:hypothetical protein
MFCKSNFVRYIGRNREWGFSLFHQILIVSNELYSRRLIPRAARRKFHFAVSWMICTHKQCTQKLFFEQATASDLGGFSSVAALFPGSVGFSRRNACLFRSTHFRCQRLLRDLHRPCLPRFYSRPNETPSEPQTGSWKRAQV